MQKINLQNEDNKLKELEKLGNIPANIGYDPYLAWVWHCGMCDSQGYIFANELSSKELEQFKRGEMKGKRLKACDRCRNGVAKVIKQLDRARAFHFNDIRFR
jgi:hypothetical protein